ncbi:MAG: glycosyltransferase family 2 protein [Patescibacteria group bacterium]
MKVSVIMPVYNGKKYLFKYAIPSLIKQVYKNWEAIIIDDGSNDGVWLEIEKLCREDSRFRCFRFSENRGLGAALNFAIKHSIGEIITFLEQDDVWLSDKLSVQVEEIRHGRQYTNCFGLIYYPNKGGKFFGVKNNFSTLAFNRKLIERFLPFPEDPRITGVEDIWAIVYLSVNKQELSLNEKDFLYELYPLVIILYHDDSLSRSINFRRIAARYRALMNNFCPYCFRPELICHFKVWRRHLFFNRIAALIPRPIIIPFVKLYRHFDYKHKYKNSINFKEVVNKYPSRIQEAADFMKVIEDSNK